MNKKLLNRLNSNIDIVNGVIKDLHSLMAEIRQDRDELMEQLGYREQSFRVNPKYKQAPEPQNPASEQEKDMLTNFVETIQKKDGRDAIIKFIANTFKEIKATFNEELKDKKQEHQNPEPPTPEAKTETILDKDFSVLGLYPKALTDLKKNNIKTIGELISFTESDLMKMPYFGKLSLQQIKDALAKFNLSLSIDPLDEKVENKFFYEYAENSKQPPIEEPILAKSIEDCNFSFRLYNCLNSHKIKTVGDLVKYSKRKLFTLRNFGNKCYGELQQFLSENKLELTEY